MSIALSLLLGATAGPPRAVAGGAVPPGWTIEQRETGCRVNLDPPDAGEPLISIMDRPLTGRSLVSMRLRAPIAIPYRAAVQLTLLPSRTRVNGEAIGFPPNSGPVTSVTLSVPTAELLRMPITRLRLAAGETRLADVSLQGWKEALGAVRTCRDAALRTMGIDPAQTANIATFARPLVEEGRWFMPQDYPIEARRARAQGRVAGRYRVASDGTVGDCVVVASSGHPALDQGTCALVLAHARFAPARDAAGRPIASPQLFAVRWTLP